jgi:iron complex outermembrane receptor protein
MSGFLGQRTAIFFPCGRNECGIFSSPPLQREGDALSPLLHNFPTFCRMLFDNFSVDAGIPACSHAGIKFASRLLMSLHKAISRVYRPSFSSTENANALFTPPPLYLNVIISGLFGLGLSAAAQAAPDDAATTTAQTEQTKPAERTENIPVLGEVTVTAPQEEGSAEVGYRMETAKQVGPWGEQSLKNSPYTETVVSRELIQNIGTGSMNHLLDLMPNATYGFSTNGVYGDGTNGVYGDGTGSPTMRGFTASGLVNGIRMPSGASGFDLDELERVEVNHGLSGFLFGGGYVGGSINFVTKRPTKTPYRNINVGNNGGKNYYVHADLGGPIGDGRFGYRLNVKKVDGEMAVHGLSVEENLFSGALDWKVTDNLQFQFDAAYREYKRNGSQPDFPSHPVTGLIRKPLDPDECYCQDWAYGKFTTKRAGFNADWTLNDIFSIRAGYRWQNSETNIIGTQNYNVGGASGYEAGDFGFSYDKRQNFNTQHGGYAYGTARFRTGAFTHRLTAGSSINQQRSYGPSSYAIYGRDDGPFNYYGNRKIPEPDWSQYGQIGGPKVTRNRGVYTNHVIGDEIDLSDQFTLMLGYVRAKISTRNYNWRTGASLGASGKYEEGTDSYTVSLVYKPRQDLSFYGTWIQAMEAGAYVGIDATPRYRNEGECCLSSSSRKHALKGETGIPSKSRHVFT